MSCIQRNLPRAILRRHSQTCFGISDGVQTLKRVQGNGIKPNLVQELVGLESEVFGDFFATWMVPQF